jgi:hypothetical protein
MTDTLFTAMSGLDAFQRECVSAIHIAAFGGGHEARLSIAGYLPTPGAAELPGGVDSVGFERWPDEVIEIGWQTPIVDQIRELEQSGICGHLNAARFRPEGSETDAADRWTVKTHAGSAGERSDWLHKIVG